MLGVAALLAALAIALAWPVPLLLSRAAWPSRSPALALGLWQAVALAGGLSMIGSLLAYGASPSGSLLAGLDELLPHLFDGPLPPHYGVVEIAALTLAAGLAVHLALNLALTAVAAERERRRQHHLIDLLSEPLPGQPRTRVLAHPVPLAYCVPGLRTTTVLTDGLVRALSPDELGAVVAHERAHLDQLHHLVQLAFRAWHSALPWFPIANRAEGAVSTLTEMLADDAARRSVGAAPLRSAAERLGSDAEPGAYADSGGFRPDPDLLEARLRRLELPLDPLPRLAAVAIVLLAVALVATPIASMLAILG